MEKKLIDYDGFEAYSKSVRKKYADKVDKVVGKQLSTNDYTNEDKKKVDAIPDNPKYTDTVPDLSGYATKNELYDKVNKWDISNETDGNSTDKVFSQQAVNYMVGGLRTQLNRYAQDLDEKADTKDIPKKLSQLTNDKTFKTESEIQSMIEKASSLKKEVVTSLPTTGKDDVIYLVKDEKGKENNNYLEYLWLNGKYELIGSTQVDLSGYAKKDDLTKGLASKANKTNVVTSVNGQKGDMMVDFFIGDDTRELNYTPKDYLEHGARFKSYTNSQFEFKRCHVVGLENLITQDYGIVNTQVPWADKSGGLPMQIAYGKGVMAIRDAVDENTWGEWKKVLTTDNLSEYATKIEIQHMIEKLCADKLNKTDIQEFTQQELEEAFK